MNNIPNRRFGPTHGISTIFRFTFLEAIRSRLFYSLLIFAALVMGLVALVGVFTYEIHVKFLKDFSYSLVSIATLFLTLFLSFDKLINEIEETTIYGILTRPIHPLAFIFGKFLAVVAILAVNVLFLGSMVQGVLYYYFPRLDPFLWIGLGFLILKLSMLTALIFVVSLVSTRALTLPIALFIYLYGHVGTFLKTNLFTVFGPFAGYSIRLLDIILPQFLYFDFENQVIHSQGIAGWYATLLLCYGVGYTLLFLYTSYLVLMTREL